MIAIIDYGAGNLHSVKNALDSLGAESKITKDANDILSADKVILPGVGAFGDAMASLEASGLVDAIKTVIARKTPFLGICLGMQLLFNESEETPGVDGLGIFGGKIVKIPNKEGLKIPHMGWNSLEFPKESRVFSNLDTDPYVYFVHSYYLEPDDFNIVSAYTTYGKKLSVAVEEDNVFLMQFHPEKSGDVGLKILRNFINL